VVTLAFGLEVEMSQVRACALKSMQYNPNLQHSRQNITLIYGRIAKIPAYLSFYEREQQFCLL